MAAFAIDNLAVGGVANAERCVGFAFRASNEMHPRVTGRVIEQFLIALRLGFSKHRRRSNCAAAR